jgi:hypothetical protein
MSSSKPIINISFAASEIHSIVIKDKFESYSTVLRKLWKQNHPLSYNMALIRNKTIDPEKQSKDAMDLVVQKMETPSLIDTTITENTDDNIGSHMNDIIDQINSADIESTTMKEIAIKEIQKKIHMSRGASNKNQLLTLYEEKINLEDKDTKDTKDKIKVITKGTNKYIKTIVVDEKKNIINIDIIGKPCLTNNNVIVVPKSRQYKLFDTVKDYDNVTAQVYMYLTNIDTTHLIEGFNGETKIYAIPFNSKYWEKNIEYNLVLCAKKLASIISSERVQDELLNQ